jgi:hypothetical protein
MDSRFKPPFSSSLEYPNGFLDVKMHGEFACKAQWTKTGAMEPLFGDHRLLTTLRCDPQVENIKVIESNPMGKYQ